VRTLDVAMLVGALALVWMLYAYFDQKRRARRTPSTPGDPADWRGVLLGGLIIFTSLAGAWLLMRMGY
jgi:hypothetical protein